MGSACHNGCIGTVFRYSDFYTMRIFLSKPILTHANKETVPRRHIIYIKGIKAKISTKDNG